MAGPKLSIDLDAIIANWRVFAKRVAPAQAAAVVKADAYGLGAERVARALAKAGCSRFYVAWPLEGEAVRGAVGAGPEILVFHGPAADTLGLFGTHGLTPVLNSLQQIELWKSANASAPAAVHVDVGMNRLGVSETQWAEAARMLPKPVRLVGHLACGDEESELNTAQLQKFERAVKLWPDAPRSLAATGGIYQGPFYHFEEVRPGIGLYGGGPASRTVVTLTAPVLQVRDIGKGETVGYGASWTAQNDATLATVGLGYADGFLRAASNRGMAFVGGQKRPIVGRVSMDLIVVDVTGLSVSVGDDIEFLGPNMRLAEVAGTMGTIDYEILTRLGSRLTRRYVGAE